MLFMVVEGVVKEEGRMLMVFKGLGVKKYVGRLRRKSRLDWRENSWKLRKGDKEKRWFVLWKNVEG